ncbi:MAG: DUF2975 domain-containing protein [Angelakisella sp.]|jgi:hypothetical protein|nr:DUF2975 domain-containing protein [Angelakisella sp.]
MWTKDYSVRLSVFFTRLFFVILGLGVLFVPRLVRLFVYYSGKESWLSIALPAAFYLCVPLAGVVLWSLERLLAGLSRGEIFTGENILHLRRISWCCFGVAGVCLGFTLCFFPFLLVSAAAAFMGLILRVIKNVFQQAMALKEENDYTI